MLIVTQDGTIINSLEIERYYTVQATNGKNKTVYILGAEGQKKTTIFSSECENQRESVRLLMLGALAKEVKEPLTQRPCFDVNQLDTDQLYGFVGDLEDLHEAADAYNRDRLERGLIPMSMVEIMEAKKLP